MEEEEDDEGREKVSLKGSRDTEVEGGSVEGENVEGGSVEGESVEGGSVESEERE